MTTNTGQHRGDGYEPPVYPRFAVTVDVVIFTRDGVLQFVLVQRGQAPFAGMWAVPGGLKLPHETLDQAARRELLEETGVDAALIPVADVVARQVEVAFDHRIVGDAVERLATAFVGPTFTSSELRAVYEAVREVQLDGASFRRSLTADDGWVVPTGKRATPGGEGGKPPELFRAGRAGKHGSPVRRPRPRSGGRGAR